MGAFIIKRIGVSLIVIFLVTVFVFALVRILPGDPVRLLMGAEASEADVEAKRIEMHYDQPLLRQYFIWIGGLFKGDFGESLYYERPNRDIIVERIPRTVSIGVPALVLSVPIALLIGLITAVRRGKPIDQILTGMITILMGTPVFWIGILAIYVFAIWLDILPIQGYVSPSEDFAQYVQKAIMPVSIMALGSLAGVARNTRTHMLESLNQDYVRTHRAFGISERKIIGKYALKNALIPVVTVLGFMSRMAIGGSLLIERVFNIPGMGQLMTNAVNNRDYILIQNCVLLIATFTVFVNVVVDILYGYVDPRVRFSRR